MMGFQMKKNNKPAIVEDAELATSSAKVETVQRCTDKKSRRLSTTAIIISILLSGGAFFSAQQQVNQQQAKIAQLEQQLSSAAINSNTKLTAAEQRITEKADKLMVNATVLLQQQSKSIASLQMAMANMSDRHPNDWLLAEADYLVKMADRKLWLEYDVVSATRLMETADQKISALNDPSLTPLRQSLANDIATLKAIPVVDRDGLVLKLNSLEQQVANLPLVSAAAPEEESNTPQVSNNINEWQSNLKQSMDDFLDHFITYRVRDGNATPLLSPKQHFYLNENIKGKLLLASNALYRQQNEVYTTALENAVLWASLYYQQDNPAVKSFIAQLNSLAKLKVDINYPQLKSQKELASLISERLRRNVQSMEQTQPEISSPAKNLVATEGNQ